MITTPLAKQLCTKTEFELFAQSQSRAAKQLTATQLRQNVKRSRTARDKYRALAERQRREARGKQQPRGRRPSKGAQRTVKKQQLFDETLQRYQKRLTDVQGKSSRAAAKKTSKKAPKKAAKKKTATKKKVAKTKKTAKAAGRKKKVATKAPKAKKKSTSSKKKAQRKPSSGGTAVRKKRPAAKTKSGTAIKQKKAGSGLIRKQKHLSARGKRNQARRDSRSR